MDFFVEKPRASTFWDYIGASRYSRHGQKPCSEVGGAHCTPLMDGNINFAIHHSSIIHFYGSCLCAVIVLVKVLSIFCGRYDVHRFLDGRLVFIVFIAHALYYNYYWCRLEGNGTFSPVLFDTSGEYENMASLIEFTIPSAVMGIAGIVATKKLFHSVFWFNYAFCIAFFIRWIILGITFCDHEFQSNILFIATESIYVWCTGVFVLSFNMYVYSRWYLYGVPCWKTFHRYHGALLSSGIMMTITHMHSQRRGTMMDVVQADILGQLALFICLWPEIKKSFKENPKEKEI